MHISVNHKQRFSSWHDMVKAGDKWRSNLMPRLSVMLTRMNKYFAPLQFACMYSTTTRCCWFQTCCSQLPHLRFLWAPMSLKDPASYNEEHWFFSLSPYISSHWRKNNPLLRLSKMCFDLRPDWLNYHHVYWLNEYNVFITERRVGARVWGRIWDSWQPKPWRGQSSFLSCFLSTSFTWVPYESLTMVYIPLSHADISWSEEVAPHHSHKVTACPQLRCTLTTNSAQYKDSTIHYAMSIPPRSPGQASIRKSFLKWRPGASEIQASFGPLLSAFTLNLSRL